MKLISIFLFGIITWLTADYAVLVENGQRQIYHRDEVRNFESIDIGDEGIFKPVNKGFVFVRAASDRK